MKFLITDKEILKKFCKVAIFKKPKVGEYYLHSNNYITISTQNMNTNKIVFKIKKKFICKECKHNCI